MINLRGDLELYMSLDSHKTRCNLTTTCKLDLDIDFHMSFSYEDIIIDGDFGYDKSRRVKNFEELQKFVNKFDDFCFIPTHIDVDNVKEYVTGCLEGIIPSEYIENHYLMDKDMLFDQLYELQSENKNHFFEGIWGGEFCDYIVSLIEDDYEQEKEAVVNCQRLSIGHLKRCPLISVNA